MTLRDIGSTAESSMTIPLEALGAPGSSGQLIIKAMFKDRDNDDPVRQNDQEARSFEVKAKLARHPPNNYDMNGAFDKNDGSSFIMAMAGTAYFEVQTQGCTLRLDINDSREASMASATFSAHSAEEARQIFLTSLAQYLDRISFILQIPNYVALVIVRDILHEMQYMSFVCPPRSSVISSGGEELHKEMQPIYALYREAMNSTSPYYKVLCFHKIMEGLLGTLRTSLRKRARNTAYELPRIKDKVPDHPDFPTGLKQYIGTPLKDFYDNFLSKQFRDAMAHFTLKRGSTLDVSSPLYISQFTDVAFVSDICTRELIQAHDLALRLVIAAERRSSPTP